MAKKCLKALLVLLSIAGIVIAVTNFTETSAYSVQPRSNVTGKWVKYISNPPDCAGEGSDCLDLTTKEPDPNPKTVSN